MEPKRAATSDRLTRLRNLRPFEIRCRSRGEPSRRRQDGPATREEHSPGGGCGPARLGRTGVRDGGSAVGIIGAGSAGQRGAGSGSPRPVVGLLGGGGGLVGKTPTSRGTGRPPEAGEPDPRAESPARLHQDGPRDGGSEQGERLGPITDTGGGS